MPETTPLIKAALNLRGGAGFDVYEKPVYMRFVATSVTMYERSTGEPVVIICDISVKVLRGNLCRDLESRNRWRG